METQTVAEAIVDALHRHGVEIMFSQSLPSAVLLAAEKAGLRQISYRTENAGAVMADGYARISGKVPVVSAQNGPAATLLVAGLAEALKASIPVVALVQEVATTQADKNAFQEFDHAALFQSCTKWSRTLQDPNRVADYIDMAFTAAASGRPGPVALMLPSDLLNQRIPVQDSAHRKANLGHFPIDRPQAESAKIAEAAQLLATAEHPLIVAGGGAVIASAQDEIQALQKECNIPVVTTMMGKGLIDETHPLSVGVAGYAMGELAPARYMRALFDKADVVLLVGTRTNQNGTDSWELYPGGANYIHIDIDAQEIGRNYEALRLLGDAKPTLAALVKALRGQRSSAKEAEQLIAEAREKHCKALENEGWEPARTGALRPELLMRRLQPHITADTIVTSDASYSSLWIGCYLTNDQLGTRYVLPRGLAGLGWGLPFALGARLARPESNVFCLVGDGGFAHVWSELETAIRNKIDVTLIVLNNGILGYQKHAENSKFGKHTTACYFAPVRHDLIAQACGAYGARVETLDQFADELERAGERGGVTLLDVDTDPDAFPPVTLFDRLRG